MGNGGGWELHTPDESKLLFTHTRERERERGRGKGNRENTGRQSFPPILHFLFFAHWQGERKSFCSQKVAMTREWNIKRATVGRDREGHRVRRGGEKRKKKEEKCRTRQLFLPFFFFPRLFIISSPFSNRRCRAPVDRKNFVAQWLIQATLYRERQLLTDATRVRAQLFPNYAGRGTLWRWWCPRENFQNHL